MGIMETRKVQTNRNSTHSISLPKPWADQLGIMHGTSLSMDMRPDGVIVVYPPGGPPSVPVEWKGEVDAEDAEDVERLVLAAYLAGYETIRLSFARHVDPGLVLGACVHACERVRGLVMVESTAHAIVLQDLLDPTEFNAPKGVHRMHLEAREMLATAISGLLGERENAPDLLSSRDDELDRMLFILTKQHRRVALEPSHASKIGILPRDSLHYLLVAQQLEAVGDDVVELANEARGSLGVEASADLRGAAKLALKALDDAVAAFFRNDIKLANETARLASSVVLLARRIPPDLARDRRAVARLPCTACFRHSRIFDSLGRIGLRAKAISEVAIDRAVDQSVRPPGSTEGG